jgi:hypothetical protein
MRLPAPRFLVVLPALAAVCALTGTGCSSSSSPVQVDSGAHDAALKDSGAKDSGRTTDAPSHPTHDAATDVAASSDAGVDAADAGPEGDAGGPSDAGMPPTRGGATTTSATATLFAVHHLWLGDSLADSTFSLPEAGVKPWSTFGYNIDGLITTQYSTDVCTLDKAAGATAVKQVDGVDGIDNSFGENILSTIAAAIPMLSETVSGSITSGSFDVLIGTVGLTGSPTQTNTGLTGALLNGAPYGGAPPLNDAGFFKVTDDWPVFSDSIRGSLDAGAVASFPTAYVTNGVWVNGSPGDLTLKLLLQGQPLVLQIHQAVVSFTHTVDGAGQDHATNGTISGPEDHRAARRDQHRGGAAGLLPRHHDPPRLDGGGVGHPLRRHQREGEGVRRNLNRHRLRRRWHCSAERRDAVGGRGAATDGMRRGRGVGEAPPA